MGVEEVVLDVVVEVVLTEVIELKVVKVDKVVVDRVVVGLAEVVMDFDEVVELGAADEEDATPGRHCEYH